MNNNKKNPNIHRKCTWNSFYFLPLQAVFSFTMASLAAANGEFCFNLFREMDNNQGSGNVFFSSLSLFTALALIRLGARGDCASQIDKVSLPCATNHGFCNQLLGQMFSPNILLQWSHAIEMEGLSVNLSPAVKNVHSMYHFFLSWNVSGTSALILCLSQEVLEVCFSCQHHLENLLEMKMLGPHPN